MDTEPNPAVFMSGMGDSPATRLKTTLPAGAYGLTPVWEDSHEAGIYTWHYLRALCPCETCRKNK
jgi:DUF971 family protein